MSDALLPLGELLEHEAVRLRGIDSWGELEQTGRINVERIWQLSQERAQAALAEGRFDDLRARQTSLTALARLSEVTSHDKPMLPRIRVELFRPGAAVAVFLGDSPGSFVDGWVAAEVVKVAKNFRPEWATGRGNSGYFWEVTAEASTELFEGLRSLRFSTTEPRVLPLDQLAWLRDSERADPNFWRIFTINAWRDWHPLWCLDRGVTTEPTRVDFMRWLRQPLCAGARVGPNSHSC